MGASYGEMLRESGELSGRPDGRLKPGVGESRKGTDKGNHGGENRETQKQERLNRTDAENWHSSSVSGENLKRTKDASKRNL